jgi:excisionase family DNA binding protein
MTIAMAEDQLLRVPEVARRLDVSTGTVLTWLRAHKLKGYRPGGTKTGWRIRESDLNAFIERSANVDGEPR